MRRGLTLVAAVVAAACAGAGVVAVDWTGPDSGPDYLAVPADALGPAYYCDSTRVPPDLMTASRPGTALSGRGRRALKSAEGWELFDTPRLTLADWRVLEDTKELVILVRQLPEPEQYEEEARTHGYVVVVRNDGTSLPRDWDRGWDVPSASRGWHVETVASCALYRRLPGEGPGGPQRAWVEADSRRHVSAASTRIPLLVREVGCANGKSATGRIRVLGLEPRADAVAVLIGVAPIPGGALCPGNPYTRYILELPENLGHRPLIDDGVYPPRVILPAP